MDDAPWTEKYRPRVLDEVLGNPAAVSELRSWARAWAAGKPARRGALLVGDPGTGKTSAALALAAEMGWSVIELNASDARNADIIRDVVTRGATSQGFSATGDFQRTSERQLKLIILDEADNVFGREDRGGLQQVLATLRETQHPILLTANDGYELSRRASGLAPLVTEVRFKRVQAPTIGKALARICREEAIDAEIEAVEALAEHAGGDVRAAVADLEALAGHTRKLRLDDVDTLGYRDTRTTMYEALRTIFGSGDFVKARDAARELDEDPDTILLWVEENVPREMTTPEARATAMDIVSRADMFLGFARRKQHFRSWAVATDLLTGGISSVKRPGRGGMVRYDFPTWLRKMSASRNARAKRDALAGKIGGALHEGIAGSRENLVPMIAFVSQRNETFAVKVASELKLTDDEVALLLNDDASSDRVKGIVKAAAPPPDTTTRLRGKKAEPGAGAGAGASGGKRRGKGKGTADDGKNAETAESAEAADEIQKPGPPAKGQKGLFEF